LTAIKLSKIPRKDKVAGATIGTRRGANLRKESQDSLADGPEETAATAAKSVIARRDGLFKEKDGVLQ